MNPIPAPPRTPTPPPKNGPADMAGLGLDGIGDLLSPTRELYDPRALSPMSENFTVRKYSTSPAITLSSSSSQPLSPTSPNAIYGSISDTSGSNTSTSLQDSKGPFNFQPMSLSKSPITKSVRTHVSTLDYTSLTTNRALDSGADISTSTAVYHIRSS